MVKDAEAVEEEEQEILTMQIPILLKEKDLP